jgi:membrane associated rhomboid family serine protease
LVVLSSALFYFYRPVAAKVFGLIWITTGICVWIAGRHAYHIGASGIIYGLASFLFFSGIFRRNIKLMAISLLIIFLYGSMIWGVFPFVAEISWESHLFGGLSGLAFARVYSRKIILSEIHKPVEEVEEENEFPYWEIENDELKDNTKTNPNDTTNYVN